MKFGMNMPISSGSNRVTWLQWAENGEEPKKSDKIYANPKWIEQSLSELEDLGHVKQAASISLFLSEEA